MTVGLSCVKVGCFPEDEKVLCSEGPIEPMAEQDIAFLACTKSMAIPLRLSARSFSLFSNYKDVINTEFGLQLGKRGILSIQDSWATDRGLRMHGTYGPGT